jgi:hypothetical protein
MLLKNCKVIAAQCSLACTVAASLVLPSTATAAGQASLASCIAAAHARYVADQAACAANADAGACAEAAERAFREAVRLCKVEHSPRARPWRSPWTVPPPP